MKVLILCEHNNNNYKKSTINTIIAGSKISKNIHVLVIGYNIKNLVKIISKIPLVSKVLSVDSKQFIKPLAENISNQIFLIYKKYNYILAPSNSYGKNILPRLAAKINVEQISDVIKIKNLNTFKRPIYAGNVILSIKSNYKIKILTIRTSSFNENKNFYKIKNKAKIKIINKISDNFNKTLFLSNIKNKLNNINLNNAKIVVAGGKALKSKENFNKLIKGLSRKLNAAIGATRSAVDLGYISNDCQIGQSGKIIAPKIYIAIGISGAIQHLTGIKDSKFILAINKDIDAPIFSIANYGIVGDLFKIVPKIIKEF